MEFIGLFDADREDFFCAKHLGPTWEQDEDHEPAVFKVVRENGVLYSGIILPEVLTCWKCGDTVQSEPVKEEVRKGQSQ